MLIEKSSLVVIEGPMGVGKRSLAARMVAKLAQLGRNSVAINLRESNDFLPQYYEQGTAFALAAQLAFLYQGENKAQAISNALKEDIGIVFQVGLFDTNRVYANLALPEDQFLLWSKVYDMTLKQLHQRKPDLVVYLSMSSDVLLQRIKAFPRTYEHAVSLEYLSLLTEAYNAFFHGYEGAPLCVVNAGELGAVSELNFDVLWQYLNEMKGSRVFFNPFLR